VGQNGALYHYEGLDTGFQTDLPVDSDGLVIDYPGDREPDLETIAEHHIKLVFSYNKFY
jgi:putative ribosome biogenesis GTPase RsgA